MRQLLAALLIPLAALGCAALPPPQVAHAPMPHLDEVAWGTLGRDCYTTVHGINVRANIGSPCHPQVEVERLIDEVLADAKVKKTRLTGLKGMSIVFDPRVFLVGGRGAQGFAFVDYYLVITDGPDADLPWQAILKHETLHAVSWRYGRWVGHADPRFERYHSESY